MNETIGLEYQDWFITEFKYNCIVCDTNFTSTQQEYSNNKVKTCLKCRNSNHPNTSIWQRLFWKSLGYN